MKINARYLAVTMLGGFLAAAGAVPAHAGSYVGVSPDPFAFVTAGFGIPGGPVICFPTVCAGNNLSHNYAYQTKDFNGFDTGLGQQVEIADMTATFSGTMYVNDAGSPGALIGNYSTPGTHVAFGFIGRTSDTEGDWDALMTTDDLNVNANGHTFSLSLAAPAPGHLHVHQIGTQAIGDFYLPVYRIDMDFDVLGNFTVDGGPSFQAPFSLNLTDTSVAPEPGTLLLLALPLAVALRNYSDSRRSRPKQ